jgi:hypothetical protein
MNTTLWILVIQIELDT